jgi:hypothetical protein
MYLDPIYFQLLAMAKLENIRREAEQARMRACLPRHRRSVVRSSTRAFGALLIALGIRIERIALHGVPGNGS